MKISKLASLCAIACASLSGVAHANLANNAAHAAIVNDANTAGRVIYLSGASAVQGGFTGIINTLFDGTPVRFTNAAGYQAAAGKLAANHGVWSGQNVIFIYRTKGGSVMGVNPVARNQAIETLVVTPASCTTGSGTASAPYACGLSNGTTLPHRVPDAGVSDIAPALFKAPLNTEGDPAEPALTDAELTSLEAKPIYSLAFGVAVTNNVPTATNLNRAALSAIMAGNVGTWAEVDPAAGTGDIVVCRRVPGSGTQAIYNLYFGNYPCGEAGQSYNIPADRDASQAWNPTQTWTALGASGTGKYTVTANTGGIVVIENSTSGEVRECLNKAVTGGSYLTSGRKGERILVEFVGGGHKAIGTLSMDSLNASTPTANWQFRALHRGANSVGTSGSGIMTWDGNINNPPVTSGDGIFPTKKNLINGDWEMQGWISFNIPSHTKANVAKLAVLEKFLNKAQDPALIDSIASLKYAAAAIPGGDYEGAGVLNVMYPYGDQCAPLGRITAFKP